MKMIYNRRNILGALAATTAAPAVFSKPASAQGALRDGYDYEIVRTESEWRNMLSEHEYRILRDFGTEPRFSSDLWSEERPGSYNCRGCELRVYDAEWKTIRNIGWVFFFHSVPNSTLTSIDVPPEERIEMRESAMSTPDTMIETHCRRCGSHLGHIVLVEGDVLHCINGTSLVFNEAT